MKTKVIEIEVKGKNGTGKSHVMTTIEKALKRAYSDNRGPVQIASYDLELERT